MRHWRSFDVIAAALTSVALWAACVSYDPTGPHAGAINGTFDAQVITVLHDTGAPRPDTSFLTVTLRDSLYYGRFTGSYRFTDGDSGVVDGTLYAHGRIEVSHFGPWPPLTHVVHVALMYPSCSFDRLGPVYVVNGDVQGDTLRLGATTSVPCADVATPFDFQLLGIRER